MCGEIWRYWWVMIQILRFKNNALDRRQKAYMNENWNEFYQNCHHLSADESGKNDQVKFTYFQQDFPFFSNFTKRFSRFSDFLFGFIQSETRRILWPEDSAKEEFVINQFWWVCFSLNRCSVFATFKNFFSHSFQFI